MSSLEDALHQLVQRGLPEGLISKAVGKIQAREFASAMPSAAAGVEDEAAATAFAVQSGEGGRPSVVARRTIEAEGDVYVFPFSWTFTARAAPASIAGDPDIQRRLSEAMTGGEGPQLSADDIAARLLDVSWPIPTQRDSVWLVEASPVAAIAHTHEPNSRCAPLLFGESTALCLWWPTQRIESGDVVTLNRGSHRVAASIDDREGSVLDSLLHTDEGEVDNGRRYCTSLVDTMATQQEERKQADTDAAAAAPAEASGEQVAAAAALDADADQQAGSADEPLLVCTDSRLLQETLTDERFGLTSEADEAAIMWLLHYKLRHSAEFPDAKFISQLPEEKFFVDKIALVRTVRNHFHGRVPEWLPDTFVMPEQALEFAGSFAKCADDTACNAWIVKSAGLTRGMDMCISSDLRWLLKLALAVPRRRLVQRYITQPLLFKNHKVDVRYYLAIRALKPVEAYVHNQFVVRAAANEYDTTDFHDFDRHWTVSADQGQQGISPTDMAADFERQFPDAQGGWSGQVEPRVRRMLHELCDAIAPHVMTEVPQERFCGLYGVDVAVDTSAAGNPEERFQPKLLEMNYAPDNTKILRQCPGFHNDVFATLFLKEPTNMVRV